MYTQIEKKPKHKHSIIIHQYKAGWVPIDRSPNKVNTSIQGWLGSNRSPNKVNTSIQGWLGSNRSPNKVNTSIQGWLGSSYRD